MPRTVTPQLPALSPALAAVESQPDAASTVLQHETTALDVTRFNGRHQVDDINRPYALRIFETGTRCAEQVTLGAVSATASLALAPFSILYCAAILYCSGNFSGQPLLRTFKSVLGESLSLFRDYGSNGVLAIQSALAQRKICVTTLGEALDQLKAPQTPTEQRIKLYERLKAACPANNPQHEIMGAASYEAFINSLVEVARRDPAWNGICFIERKDEFLLKAAPEVYFAMLLRHGKHGDLNVNILKVLFPTLSLSLQAQALTYLLEAVERASLKDFSVNEAAWRDFQGFVQATLPQSGVGSPYRRSHQLNQRVQGRHFASLALGKLAARLEGAETPAQGAFYKRLALELMQAFELVPDFEHLFTI